ncbi:MAG: NAD(+)/NADH kinase [Gemmataceae bacterium]
MRFFVLGNALRPGVREAAQQLLPRLASFGEVVAFDLDQTQDLSTKEADLAFVLGGDGAILRAARQMAYHQVPVLGINLGLLGFLADLALGEVESHLPQIVRGEYSIAPHIMFECRLSGAGAQQTFLGLNEVAVLAGHPFRMLQVTLEIDGEAVLKFGGDGIIVSTPIGSTAHNLAAGGPILGQQLPAFVVTPFAAHSLAARPVVESADKVYTIRLNQPQGAWLVIDGQDQIPLADEPVIEVRRAPVTFQLVKVPGKSYFRTLRDKLRWGTTPNYQGGEPSGQ